MRVREFFPYRSTEGLFLQDLEQFLIGTFTLADMMNLYSIPTEFHGHSAHYVSRKAQAITFVSLACAAGKISSEAAMKHYNFLYRSDYDAKKKQWFSLDSLPQASGDHRSIAERGWYDTFLMPSLDFSTSHLTNIFDVTKIMSSENAIHLLNAYFTIIKNNKDVHRVSLVLPREKLIGYFADLPAPILKRYFGQLFELDTRKGSVRNDIRGLLLDMSYTSNPNPLLAFFQKAPRENICLYWDAVLTAVKHNILPVDEVKALLQTVMTMPGLSLERVMIFFSINGLVMEQLDKNKDAMLSIEASIPVLSPSPLLKIRTTANHLYRNQNLSFNDSEKIHQPNLKSLVVAEMALRSDISNFVAGNFTLSEMLQKLVIPAELQVYFEFYTSRKAQAIRLISFAYASGKVSCETAVMHYEFLFDHSYADNTKQWFKHSMQTGRDRYDAFLIPGRDITHSHLTDIFDYTKQMPQTKTAELLRGFFSVIQGNKDVCRFLLMVPREKLIARFVNFHAPILNLYFKQLFLLDTEKQSVKTGIGSLLLGFSVLSEPNPWINFLKESAIENIRHYWDAVLTAVKKNIIQVDKVKDFIATVASKLPAASKKKIAHDRIFSFVLEQLDKSKDDMLSIKHHLSPEATVFFEVRARSKHTFVSSNNVSPKHFTKQKDSCVMLQEIERSKNYYEVLSDSNEQDATPEAGELVESHSQSRDTMFASRNLSFSHLRKQRNACVTLKEIDRNSNIYAVLDNSISPSLKLRSG